MADKTFDQLNPPAAVTNPGGVAGFQEYPRHMHKHGEPSVQVPDDAGRDEKREAGYFLTAREAELAAEAAAADAEGEDAPKTAPKTAPKPKKKAEPKA
jgi:hypothetical protein